MLFDHSEKGNLKIDVRSYIKDITEILPESLSDKVKCPWTTRLFTIATTAIYETNKREKFSTHI